MDMTLKVADDPVVQKFRQQLVEIAREKQLGKEVRQGKWVKRNKGLEPFVNLSIPAKDSNYAVLRRMLWKFEENKKKLHYITPNYVLYSCIYPTVPGNNYKRRHTRKKDYLANQEKHNLEIESRVRTLRKYLKKNGFTIKFRTNVSEIIPLT